MATQPQQSASGQPSEPTPAERLLQLGTSYMVSACISVTLRLRIAELLDAGPKPVYELARIAKVNEGALYRVLRALASVGVFTETSNHQFANTPISQAMREGTNDSVRPLLLWITDNLHFRVFGELMHSVETGGTAIKKVTGMEPFEYFEREREVGEIFNAAMTGFSAQVVPAVLSSYDFSGMGTLADIAGGHGFLLASILKEHPDIQGILFDLPHVVSGARPILDSRGVAKRCQLIAGDIFKAVPPADNYIMKHIIHDWDDARALQILKNCAASMRGKGKVILIESVIAPGNIPQMGKWVDMEMLAFPGGRERTEEEFAALFSQAGLRLTKVIPTQSPISVVEAVKA